MTATKATNITFHPGAVTQDERAQLLGQQGATVWFTGLSASGKSTIATALEQALLNKKLHSFRLDGDNVRFGLNKDLGFDPASRVENVSFIPRRRRQAPEGHAGAPLRCPLRARAASERVTESAER